MISTQRQLESALKHYFLESTMRTTILCAVQRGITEKPEYVRIAIEELANAKKFGMASTFALKIDDEKLARELMDKQFKANVASVQSRERTLRDFEGHLSKIEDPQARRSAIITAVQDGITNKLEHVRLALAEYELRGPGMFPEAEKFARSVGACTSDICEREGWVGLAARMSEGKGDNERTLQLYGMYAKKLEEHGKYGLAAEISFYKLGDLERAVKNAKKAGNWELAAELHIRLGDREEASAAGKLASMLRQA